MPIAKSCFSHRRAKVEYTTSVSLTEQAIHPRVGAFCIKIRVFKGLPALMFRSFNRKRNPKVATSQMKKKQRIERFRQYAYALNTPSVASKDTASSRRSCATPKKGFADLVMETCCGLHNFRLNFRPWAYPIPRD